MLSNLFNVPIFKLMKLKDHKLQQATDSINVPNVYNIVSYMWKKFLIKP